MRRWFRAIWRALHDGPDVVTWVGHWMVGLGAALIGARADGAPNPAPGWKVQEYRRRLKAVLRPTDPEPKEESENED